MPHAASYSFAYHHMLVVFAGTVCLFGTWVGMRHFARARATQGSTRYGWLFMASVGTGAALWASTFISILALDPSLNSGFEPVATGLVLVIAVVACLIGFEIGSRHFTLAPELGGLVMGVGILAMHFLGLHAWHIAGTTQWNVYGIVTTFVLGLGLSALSVSRANRPVTRWCRHGAAIVLAFMICAMHYALTVSTSAVADASIALPPYLIPANMLGFAVVGAVLLVMGSGFSTYIIDLQARTESADRIHQLSFNDTMTGLPNRIAFNERLSFDAAEAHEKAHRLAAFSIDLDGFKDVNDVFGHSAGDLLLIEVADRMRRLLGPGEFLARQSGDEFLGLQMSGNHPQDAQAFAARIAEVLAKPFMVGDQQVTLTASIGFSVFPTDTHERDQVLSNAKLAMHRGKSKQRGAICMYQRPRPARIGARSAKRGRARRTRTALPVAGIAREWKNLRRRSLDALAPSQARHDFAGGIHSSGRGNRGDHSDGRVGAAHRLPRRRRGPDTRNHRGQSIAGAVRPRGFGRNHSRDPAGNRPVAEASRSRSHGIDHHVGPDKGPAYPAQAEVDGHLGGDG
jgi:diguanylate cyclase (GGDEF)-like protein